MTTDNLKSKGVKGAGINVVAQFVGLIFHIGGVIILARLLTPKDFGLVTMVTAFSMWFMNFGSNGFTEYIIQKEQISAEELSSVFWLHILIACLLSVGFSFFGLYLVDFYSEPQLWKIAAVMSTSFILMGLCTSHLAILQREMKFISVAFLGLIALILSFIFSIGAAVIGMSYWAIVIRQLTIPVVTVIGAWALCTWRPSYPKQITHASHALKYAIQVYSNISIGYVMRNADKVLLGKFHGTVALGLYDRAYYLSMTPVEQLLSPLHNVALATLSRLRNDREQFIRYYIKAVAMVSFLGIPVALILTILAEDLILLLLGPSWHEAGRIVAAFGPGIAGMLIYGTYFWLHLSLGTPDRWLKWNLISSSITVSAFFVAAPYGGFAMAIAYSVTVYALLLPALWYAGRPIDLSIKTLIESLWPYLASGAAVCILWILLSSYYPPLMGFLGMLSLIPRILIISSIALFLYLALVIVCQRSFRSIRDVNELVRIFLSGNKNLKS